jgi:hypothetical protein
MIVHKPDGTKWRIENAPAKLALRARLPGARVFDLAAESLRRGRAAGLVAADCLPLALPASWCVNSPAPSTVLRRWTLAPQREVWLSLVEVLEEPRVGPLAPSAVEAIELAIVALGTEPFVVEAVSKVLALLVPDVVPLLPPPACSFVLGAAAADARAFLAMVDWFALAVAEALTELTSCADGHREVTLSPAQVLDRLLWFDSEGFRHFRERPSQR